MSTVGVVRSRPSDLKPKGGVWGALRGNPGRSPNDLNERFQRLGAEGGMRVRLSRKGGRFGMGHDEHNIVVKVHPDSAAEDAGLRRNRHALLSELHALMNRVADLAKLAS